MEWEDSNGESPESETSIPMTPIVKAKLRAHLVGHSHQLLFPNKLGRPFNRGRFVKKIFHPILDKLGISHKDRRVGFHAFRHTLASMLLQTTGVKVAQRQLRHSDAAFTVEVYGHVLGDDHSEAMDNLESVLFTPSGSLRYFWIFPISNWLWIESLRESGLGSSHTAPCGAAVPARPPTRCDTLSRSRKLTNGPREPKDRVRRS